MILAWFVFRLRCHSFCVLEVIAMPSLVFCDCTHTHIHSRFSGATCNIENSNKQDGFACQCSVGYKGAITWSGAKSSGTCSKTQCTGIDAATLNHGSVTKDKGDDHGSKTTFQCNTRYVLVGPESIICDAASADAPWPTPPKCIGTLFDVVFHEQMSAMMNVWMLKHSVTSH